MMYQVDPPSDEEKSILSIIYITLYLSFLYISCLFKLD